MPVKSLVTYNKTVLRNGLRVITEKVPSARSIAIGVWVDVGSRDEGPQENGISHFIEHMVFKGTKTRSSRKIASWLESLGGGLNAFTSREQTCFYALVLDEHLEQAVDILSDITMNATMNPVNIEKEKLVVIEEIHEVEENPSDYIHDIFYESFWRGQPLGRPILGSEDIIMSLKRKDVNSYMRENYRSGRIVISAAGNVSHRKLINLVRDKFNYPEGNGSGGERAIMPTNQDFSFVKRRNQQNHVCIGFPGFKYDHPDRFPMLGLYTYLGSGMSSVLFQKIREEKGMAYTIYTFADFFDDAGLFGIYFASDKRHLAKAIELTLKELHRVKKNKLSEDRLDKVKAQIKGNLTLGLESTSGRMTRLGRQELLSGEYCSLSEALNLIDNLNPSDITEVARKIFKPEGLTITSLGPGSKRDIQNIDLNKL